MEEGGDAVEGVLGGEGEGLSLVELLGEENGKTWRLFEEEKVAPGGTFDLGDEPLSGDEAERP